MKTKRSKTRSTLYYNILGVLSLILIFKIFFKIISFVDKEEKTEEFEIFQALENQKAKSQSYAYNIDLEQSGILFLKYENEPYPLFYISVVDSTVLHQDALIPILERLIQSNGIRSEIKLKTSWQYRGDESPGEVRYVLNQDFDHVVAEKVFTIKKSKWGGLVFEDRN